MSNIFYSKFSELSGERLDPIFYVAIQKIQKELVKKAKYKCIDLIKSCSINRGKFGHRPRNDPRFYGGEYPFIQTGDIVEASKNNSSIKYTQTLNELGLSTSKLFEPPKLLFTIAANIGDTAILDYPSCFPDSIVALVPNDDTLSLEYLNIYLKLIKPHIEALAPYSAQKNLNNQQLAKIPLIIPPSNIQNQIIQKMEQSHKQKQQKEQEAQKKLESIDSYLLDALGIEFPIEREESLEDRVFVRRFSELKGRFDGVYYSEKFIALDNSLVNSHYPLMRLGDICEINRGGSPRPIHNFITDDEDGINWIKIGDTKGIDKYIYKTKQKIIPKGIKHSRMVYEGDFILSNSMSFGRPYIMKTTGCIHDGWLLLRKREDIVSEDFLYSILNSALIYKFFKKETIGGVVENLSIDLVKKIKIPVPPLEIQNKIANNNQLLLDEAQALKKEATEIYNRAKLEVEKMILGENLSRERD